MADPLSVAVTVITLADICTKILSRCYTYFKAVKDARRYLSIIIDNVVGLKAILEDLRDLANNSRRTTFLKSLAEPNSPLNKCESALEKLDALSNKWTDSKNLLQLLKRPQLKESLLSILKDIEDQKVTLI